MFKRTTKMALRLGRVIGLLVCLLIEAGAERLPLRAFTTADGLPADNVNRIVRDSRGFLWFCTTDGLSRFDGYTFANYGTDHGLPHPNVTNFLETRTGEFWVATHGGLVRFNPKGMPTKNVVNVQDASVDKAPMFAVILPEDQDRRAKAVEVVLEGRNGVIWVGTYKGLYRLERTANSYSLRVVEIGMPADTPEQSHISDLLEDRHGSLWVATSSGLYRVWPDGTTARYTSRDGVLGEHFHDLFEDHEGRLWAGTRNNGFFRFVADETHAPPAIVRAYKKWDGATVWVNQLFETSDHRFWVAANSGLVEFFPDRDKLERQFRAYTTRHGLSHYEITALNEDTGGNLWLGSYSGAMKLARNGFATYDERDGLLSVGAIFGDRAGGVCFRAIVIGDERRREVDEAKLNVVRWADAYHFRHGRFDRERFTWYLPGAPKSGDFGWVGEHLMLQARNGEWWMGTGEGVYRFPASDDFTALKTARPMAVYQTKEGLLPPQQVFRIFEDSRGDIWASTTAPRNGLARWDRATERFLRDLAESPGLPSSTDDLARSFGEDRAGNVWIGFATGAARYRDGRFTFFTAKDGLPTGAIQDIHSDRVGRLWLASGRSGLVRVDEPEATRPTFRSYSTEQGLSSNSAIVITEDLEGNIYAGTGRGLDRLDPASGSVKHFTTADGLAPGDIAAAFCDRDGVLWIGTRRGLSRYVPVPELPSTAPPILITALLVAGEQRAVSALGETDIVLSDLTANRNQLQVEFVGLSFSVGEVPRYQYRLEGGSGDWSAPTETRIANFANLAPGRYRFLVRAVNAEGVASERPATLQFTILPPIWQRWWVLALAVFAAALSAYALHRYRFSRLVELDHVRTRIASDLHDDIGAGLSRIAVLSEVAGHEAGNTSPVTERLSVIAKASRELVDSMSDIVWVINPERDQLRDLTQRMRRFASDLFTSRGIEFTFRAPSSDHHLRVGADVRRHIFLIFKESVNNIIRHSRCEKAAIDLSVDGGSIVLTVEDDGSGFDTAYAADGNGVANMRVRARLLGGSFRVDSGTQRGTKITLSAPIRGTVKERNGRLRGSSN